MPGWMVSRRTSLYLKAIAWRTVACRDRCLTQCLLFPDIGLEDDNLSILRGNESDSSSGIGKFRTVHTSDLNFSRSLFYDIYIYILNQMSNLNDLESVGLEGDHMGNKSDSEPIDEHEHIAALQMHSSEDISSIQDPMQSARVSPDRPTDRLRSYINPTAGSVRSSPEQTQRETVTLSKDSPHQAFSVAMQQSPAASTPASFNLPLPPPQIH